MISGRTSPLPLTRLNSDRGCGGRAKALKGLFSQERLAWLRHTGGMYCTVVASYSRHGVRTWALAAVIERLMFLGGR